MLTSGHQPETIIRVLTYGHSPGPLNISLVVEGGLRLHELERGTEATPSKATRGDWKRGEWLSRNAMKRGASWSQHLDGNFAERTPVFYDYQTLSSPYGMLISVLVCCCM